MRQEVMNECFYCATLLALFSGFHALQVPPALSAEAQSVVAPGRRANRHADRNSALGRLAAKDSRAQSVAQDRCFIELGSIVTFFYFLIFMPNNVHKLIAEFHRFRLQC